MAAKQYKYLDFLKVIAISFVCMYHFWHGTRQELSGIPGFVQTYSYSLLSTCVPLFFMVNGALLLNRETFDAGKHFRKLLVIFLQYVIWHAITAVILGLQEGLNFASFNKHQLLNIFLLLGTPDGVDLDHFWFIPVLCGIYLLVPFLRAVFEQEREHRNARTSVLCLLAVTYFVCFLLQDISVFKKVSPYLMYFHPDPLGAFQPFGTRIGTMLTFFLIGGFLHKYREKTGKIPGILRAGLVPAGLLVLYAMVLLDPDLDIVFGGYSSTGTLLCTVGLFLLASGLEEKLPEKGSFRWVTRSIGRNTMTIYYTHWIVGHILLAAFPFGYGFFWNLLKTGVLVISGTMLAEIMKRIPVVKYLVH